ncbi:MAG TPA: LacI family DNA-binding transcriptional regulator, partial [Negativicutes bacterium]|nr:LacI family DNA-binding transcriptional regulator [Negativicutes bacterium]
MRVTIKDIAQKTGLSITTVSLVLNGKAVKISEESKALVHKVAKELNYRPNQMAVGLIKKKTNTLGLIIPDISNTFFAELAKCVEDEGRKYDYNVILCNTNDKHD